MAGVLSLLASTGLASEPLELCSRLFGSDPGDFDEEVAALGIVEWASLWAPDRFDRLDDIDLEIGAVKLSCNGSTNCLEVLAGRRLVLEDVVPLRGDSAKLRSYARDGARSFERYLNDPDADAQQGVESIVRFRLVLMSLYGDFGRALPLLNEMTLPYQGAVWFLRGELMRRSRALNAGTTSIDQVFAEHAPIWTSALPTVLA